MSVRECTKLYNKMLKKHQRKVEPNRVNCYKCDRCGTITKTIDVDDGVNTPYRTFGISKLKEEETK